MITRIEIDGFKSFVDFGLDLPPFLAVIGTNASGKSNLLDALRFLSAAVDRDIYAAVDAVRGDPEGLFRERGDGSRVDHMRFAVELLAYSVTEGGASPPSRYRYELTLGWRSGRVDLPTLSVVEESLFPLAADDDRWPVLAWAAPGWVSSHVGYKNAPQPKIAESSNIVYAEGRGSSFTRVIPDDVGPVSDLVLSDSGNSTIDPWSQQAFAAPLADLRVLQLEDAALRGVSSLGGRTRMGSDGRDLPGQLRVLRANTATDEDPEGVLADIQADLARIVRGVSGFALIEDAERRDVRIVFEARNEPRFGAEIASGGTLRTLGILTALYNMSLDSGDDMVAVEEPENGVFPEHLRELLATMRSMATDPATDEPERPLSQVLLTSHSPAVLDVVPRAEIVFLDTVTRVENGVPSQVTRARRLLPAGVAPTPDDKGRVVAESELDRFRSGQRTRG